MAIIDGSITDSAAQIPAHLMRGSTVFYGQQQMTPHLEAHAEKFRVLGHASLPASGNGNMFFSSFGIKKWLCELFVMLLLVFQVSNFAPRRYLKAGFLCGLKF